MPRRAGGSQNNRLHADQPQHRRRPAAALACLAAAAALAMLALPPASGVAESQDGESGADRAAPLESPAAITAGVWRITAYADATGAMACVARRELDGGGADQPRILEFRRSALERTLRLTADDWTLPRDVPIPVAIAAGMRLRGGSEAMRFRPELVDIALGDMLVTLERLQQVPAIELRIAELALTLPLADMAAMRTAFAACIVERLGPEHAGAGVVLPTITPDPEVVEEHTFLFAPIDGVERLFEALLVRPAGAVGRLPVALFVHGQGRPEDNTAYAVAHFQRQARDIAQRGYLAVAVLRRGFGWSDGLPGLPGPAPYSACAAHTAALNQAAADDLAAVLAALAERPDADLDRIVLIGQSAGAPAALTLAARGVAGLRAVITLSGGVRCGQGDAAHAGPALAAVPDWFEQQLAQLGAHIRVPSLWLYAAGDSFFSETAAREMHAAFANAGAPAELAMLPPIDEDGHNLFASWRGRDAWLPLLDEFLRRHGLPTWGAERVDAVIRHGGIDAAYRDEVAAYLSSITPRALVVDRGSGRPYRATLPLGLANARMLALLRCRSQGGMDCVVVAENGRLVPVGGQERQAAQLR